MIWIIDFYFEKKGKNVILGRNCVTTVTYILICFTYFALGYIKKCIIKEKRIKSELCPSEGAFPTEIILNPMLLTNQLKIFYDSVIPKSLTFEINCEFKISKQFHVFQL